MEGLAPLDGEHHHGRRFATRQQTLPSSGTETIVMDSEFISVGRDAYFLSAGDEQHQAPRLSKRQLADWLSNLNQHQVQKDIFEKVVDGTGSWIFGHPKYEEWLSGRIKTLWGVGNPGAGKTCLTSVVVNRFLEGGENTIAFIYCQYKEELSTANILACLLKQLVEANDVVARYVMETLYKSCNRSNTRPSKPELLSAILGALNEVTSQVFFVADALDELQETVRFELIKALTSLGHPLFITSRPLSLPDLKDPDFEMRAPQSDFYTFVESKLDSMVELKPFPGGARVRAEIINKIYLKCDGIFLLAALQIDAMMARGVVDTHTLRAAINELPTTLDDMYHLTMERINNQSREKRSLACQVLLWITHAARLLQADELLEVLAMNNETGLVDEDCRKTEPIVVSVCLGLVMVETESRTIRLIHETVQEFLNAQNLTMSSLSPHETLANLCAIYLGQDCLNYSSITSEETLAKMISSYPFVDYACQNLGYHTQSAGICASNGLPGAITQLLDKHGFLLLDLMDGRIDHGQLVHFAAYYGLMFLSEKICHSSNQKSQLGCNSLYFACLGGHISLAEQLLDSGVVLDTKTSFGTTALHPACNRGHLDLVKLLLKRGQEEVLGEEPAFHQSIIPSRIDINAQEVEHGESALYLASRNGHHRVVQKLLDIKGIDVKLKCKDGRAPLHIACDKGNITVVELLLKSTDMDINARTEKGSTALHWAAHHGNEAVFQLLLDSPGIDINARNKEGTTALHIAAHDGHNTVVQLLFNSPGIDINARAEKGFTALHWAAQTGHNAVVQLFLNSPCIDINMRTEDGFTALHLAAQNNHEAVAQLLLNSPGIGINTRTEKGFTALHIATQNNHEAFAQLLLNSPGIDINAKTKKGFTILHLAAQKGYEAVVQLFLNSSGIDINAKTDDNWTPLHFAAYNSHKAVVQLLLTSSGIDINAKDDNNWTPLHFAAYNGHEAVVQLLLNSPGIDINAKMEGATALHLAVDKGHEAVVQLLLNSSGMDINAREDRGLTALYIAAFLGHEAVTKLLLNSPGIVTNIRNTGAPYEGTPLDAARCNGHYHIIALLQKKSREELNITRGFSDFIHDHFSHWLSIS